MERLTEKHYIGNDHYMKCSGENKCNSSCEDCEELVKIVERLAAYEDTGLTPAEVMELKAENRELRGRLERVRVAAMP